MDIFSLFECGITHGASDLFHVTELRDVLQRVHRDTTGGAIWLCDRTAQ